ncbi:hypothetical protein [Halobacterium salinarum]|uniref:hypothetical protein n=1 Tax=Halobacterium salinarum TaxID=2242 RepID=UPI00298CCB42|nr:hypothetical protein [Halobacterium salinarum]WJK64924.1 hypothetical protein QSJ49_12130 [Halobacterium salinarum]
MDRSHPPLGISVVSVIWLLMGLLNGAQTVRVVTTGPVSSELLLPLGLVSGVSIAYLVVGIGLWRTRSWAWKGAIVLAVIGIVGSFLQQPVGLLIALLLLCVGGYLILERDQFLSAEGAV